jgi:hypothetical protein
MKRHGKRYDENLRSQVLFLLFIPLLIIPFVSFGYTRIDYTISSSTNRTSVNQLPEESIRIVDGQVVFYNGYGGYVLNFDENELYFEDDLIFPGWELVIDLYVHNDGAQPVYIGYEIYYSWDDENWIQVLDPNNPTELYDEFRMIYSSEFYDEEGAPWDFDKKLNHCNIVINREHLIFDAQDRPDLQGKTFTIKVEVLGSTTR